MSEETMSLPMVALRGMTILPETVVHFDVSRERSVEAIQEAMIEEQKIFLVAQKEIDTESPQQEDLYQVGTIASIKQVIKLPKHVLRVLVAGEDRAKLCDIEYETPYMRVQVTKIEDEESDFPGDVSPEAMVRGLQEIFLEYAVKSGKITKETASQMTEMKDVKKLVDRIAANIPLYYKELQEILEETDTMKRYELLAFKLVNEVRIIGIKEDIQQKVKERVDSHQREYILREQLKLIREELGEDTTISDGEEFEEAVKNLSAPQEVIEKLQKEINRFKSSQNSPAENGVIRTYIETMLEMPWDKTVEDHHDLGYAKKVLEEDHYGLEQVKERILEFLAVRVLTKKGNSPIVCLVGPPGTGKTSIAKSLARALKKPYVRISLGGVRDEAEI
ncbi:MAG: LON peptidase substrate-binding domain-containing protein, partial [Hungatella sp.]